MEMSLAERLRRLRKLPMRVDYRRWLHDAAG